MSEPTPGPWKIESGGWSRQKGTAEFVLGSDGQTVVAECHTGGGEVNDSEYGRAQTKADARLIAAAPDLLEALEAMAERFSLFPKPTTASESNSRNALLNEARAAIAKARGGGK